MSMSVQEPALQDSYWMSTHLSLLLSCADDFRSYCLPRCHLLSCQFLTDTVNSQLMGSLGGRTGPGGPHLCSLGGTTEWVCICCSEASLEMVVPSYQAWLLWKVSYDPVGLMLSLDPCIQYTNCKNATHINMGFPTALVILQLWYVQDEKHKTFPYTDSTVSSFYCLNITIKSLEKRIHMGKSQVKSKLWTPSYH